MGDHHIVTLEYQDHTISAVINGSPPEAGRKTRFSIDKSALLYFDPDTGKNLEA